MANVQLMNNDAAVLDDCDDGAAQPVNVVDNALAGDMALLLRSLKTPLQTRHFGNSIRIRLRNHGTSDGRTWMQTRAVSCRVSASTLQARGGAVSEVL